LESRNPKQIQRKKKEKLKQRTELDCNSLCVFVLHLDFLYFEFVSDCDIRISDFAPHAA